MFRSLRVPEKLFSAGMWIVSLAFAGFLVGLGSKIVGELPGVDQDVTIDQFVDPAQRNALRTQRDSLNGALRELEKSRERAELQLSMSRNTYEAHKDAFKGQVANIAPTVDPANDPNLAARARVLDALSAQRRDQELIDELDTTMLATRQALSANMEAEAELERAASGTYQRALFMQELRLFAIRLAIVVPLLVLSGWMIVRKRRHEYWPLYRGFVLFSAFTFFVELVPYLPSYGGYVRHGVGIVVSALAGVYVIRGMRRYLAKRKMVEQQSEAERRRAIMSEAAVKQIGTGVCPGCERTIAGGAQNPSNFCVHCGLRLFDTCGKCHTRKNAFFPYCPACGVPADQAEASEPVAPGTKTPFAGAVTSPLQHAP